MTGDRARKPVRLEPSEVGPGGNRRRSDDLVGDGQHRDQSHAFLATLSGIL